MILFNEIKNAGCKALIYTNGNKSVEVRTDKLKLSYPVPYIKVISTIGAGDTFNSGIIYQLFKNHIDKSDLPLIEEHRWKEIVNTAAGFAAEVCQSYDNYISVETASSFHN